MFWKWLDEFGTLLFFLLILAASLWLCFGKSRSQEETGPAHVSKDGPASDGTPEQIPLPPSIRMRNVGGSDGAGLCVNTSLEHAARYQGIFGLYGLREWSRQFPGGSYPERVDKQLAEFCRTKGVSLPLYLNVETCDLDLLRKATDTGRPVSITYSVSPTGRYEGRRIAHMLNLVAAGAGKGPDGKGWWGIMDNNHPDSTEWMSEAQFRQTWCGRGQGWAVIFLDPAPPAIPAH